MSTESTNGAPKLVVKPEAIARLRKRLEQLTNEGAFTGSVLIAQDGNILLSQGFGFSDRVQRIPNTPRTRFHLGSVTKAFTALGIIILQAQGKLSIKDPICHFIPGSPKEWQDITIHHLLTHTSGLSSHQSDQHYRKIESGTSGPVTPSEQACYLGLTSEWILDTRPGEQYAYNNFGYILLSYIIERASGQSYADFLERTILVPLKMRNTGYQDVSSGVAMLYTDQDDTTGAEFGSPPISEGSGHLFSTVEDLFLLDQALYTDQLLPRTELERMYEPFVRETEFPGIGYGYGWFLSEAQVQPVIVSAGGGPAFATLIIRYPQDRLAMIVLTNQGKIDHFAIWAVITNEIGIS